MTLYPLKLKPVLKSAVWGGNNICEVFGIGEKDIPCAEAWTLTLRGDGVNVIENGEYAGKTLEELANTFGMEKICGISEFPVLIKIIDANDKLSVQVHPDNAYAKANGLDAGKTEMWYVLDAKEGATLVMGLKEGVDAQKIHDSAINGDCEKYLNYVPVKKGDCFFIPAGLVHAIGAGILVAEIQQNSNTTYRLYDYNRTDKNGNKREIHTERAKEVIKTSFDLSDVRVNEVVSTENGVVTKILSSCEYFTAGSMVIPKNTSVTIEKKDSYLHVMCISGGGVIIHEGKEYAVSMGESYLLPVELDNVTFSSTNGCELILSH